MDAEGGQPMTDFYASPPEGLNTALLRRRAFWGTGGADEYGYARIDALEVAADVNALCDEVDLLMEMLTAATDTAMQRGKQLDAARELVDQYVGYGNEDRWLDELAAILDGPDGG